MDTLHSLLQRQLTKLYGGLDRVPDEIRPLLDLVDQAYRQADHDRGMLERSLDLSSKELRQANEDLWRVFRLLPDRFFRVDRRGIVLDGGDDGSSAGRAFAGRHIGDALGQRAGRTLQQAIEQSARSGRRISTELAGEGPDDGRYFEAITLPLTEDQIVVFVRDRTRELRLQEQLRQSQKMEAVGQLAGGIAHDFNNLLTVILGNVELELTRRPKQDQAALDGIRAAGERAAALTSQLLAFGRKQVLHPRSVNLNETVSQMIELLRRLIGENIRIESNLAADSGPVLVDPMQLEQVIMNLALNARDAMPSGGTLTFSTANENIDLPKDGMMSIQEIPPGAYVAFSVKDTGVGMTPEVRAHLFEPFFTTKPVGKGSGLGLATVYGIVRQSGGHVSVDTAPGRGTTFRLLLPRGDLAATLHDMRPAAALPPPPGRETILVVEDEEAIRRLATAFLERQGYRVLTAESGEEALGALDREASPIHLLLTDVMMQGMGGVELARRVRQRWPRIRTIYMSGYPDVTVTELGIDAVGRNYLKKPFRGADLVEKVRAVLDQP